MTTLVLGLPPLPDITRPEAHWWLITEGSIVERGADAGWIGRLETVDQLVALAPTARVRVTFSPLPPDLTPQQGVTSARLRELDASLGDDVALHVVASAVPDRQIATAVVDNGVMAAWLDWLQAQGADPRHVVPVGALLARGNDWIAATVGADHLLARGPNVLPNEPELASLLTAGAEIRSLSGDDTDALVLRAEAPLLDLRTGRFARGRRIVFDRSRLRELVLIAAAIPLLALAWALVSVWRLEAATDRLDADTLARAQSALGRPVTLETAESELAQRPGARATGGLLVPLTGLYQAMQAEPTVSATVIGYTRDGTLSTTLAGPTVDALNRILVALQSGGYRVTAVPRTGSDGRSMIDLTIRSRA